MASDSWKERAVEIENTTILSHQHSKLMALFEQEYPKTQMVELLDVTDEAELEAQIATLQTRLREARETATLGGAEGWDRFSKTPDEVAQENEAWYIMCTKSSCDFSIKFETKEEMIEENREHLIERTHDHQTYKTKRTTLEFDSITEELEYEIGDYVVERANRFLGRIIGAHYTNYEDGGDIVRYHVEHPLAPEYKRFIQDRETKPAEEHTDSFYGPLGHGNYRLTIGEIPDGFGNECPVCGCNRTKQYQDHSQGWIESNILCAACEYPFYKETEYGGAGPLQLFSGPVETEKRL